LAMLWACHLSTKVASVAARGYAGKLKENPCSSEKNRL
jgi:hypothetical protein